MVQYVFIFPSRTTIIIISVRSTSTKSLGSEILKLPCVWIGPSTLTAHYIYCPLDRHRQVLEKVLHLQWLIGDFGNPHPLILDNLRSL